MARDNNFDLPEQKSEQEIVAMVKSQFKWGLDARDAFERKAMQSFLFWAGDCYSSVHSDLRTRHRIDIELPPYCETSRIVDAQIPIYCRQLISTAVQGISDFEAVPATRQTEDKEAAALSTKLIRMREREDHEDELREDELLWLFGSGEVLRRTWYNPRRESADGMKGEVDTEVVTLLHYVKCPTSAGEWPPRWIIEFDARHVDWIKQEYGITVEPENIADQTRSLDALAMNVVSGRSLPREEKESSAILLRMSCAPSVHYPKGQTFVVAGDKLAKQHKFQADVFPYSKAGWINIPGRLYDMSYIEPLLSDQRQLNTIVNQYQEVKNRQMRGDIMHDGQGETTEVILDEKTGQKEIRLPPNTTRWEFLKYDLNTDNIDKDFQRVMKNMHDKGGNAEPTLGQVTSRKTTLGELQLLRESSMQNVAHQMTRFDRYVCKIAQQKIALARQFYTAARMLVDIAADTSDYFFGAELRNTRDVIAIPIPRMTPAMKRQAQMEAAEKGLLGPWRDPNTGLPDRFMELAARRVLRAMGLQDEDDRLSVTSGPFDELEQEIGEISKLGWEAYLTMMIQKLQAQMQGPPPQPQMAPPPGMQAPPGMAPPSDAQAMGMAEPGAPIPEQMGEPYTAI